MPAHRPRRAPTSLVVLRRILAVTLALALLVTGCGGDPAKPGAEKGTSAKAAEKSADTAEAEPAPDPGYQAPRVGSCYRMAPRQSRASVAASPRVNCKQRHNTVVAYVGYVPRPVSAQTPLPQRRALGKRVCEPAFRRVVGGTLADRATSILTWTLFTPGQAQLERGARWVRCDVLARSGSQLVALPAGRPLLREGIPDPLRVCQSEAGADVSCAEPHAFKVAAVFRVVGDAYPDPGTYTPAARDRCKELIGAYGGYWQPPGEAGWRAGDRFVRCLTPAT